MSLATEPSVERWCHGLARRWCSHDPDNAYGEAVLGVLRTERRGIKPHVDPIAQAKHAGTRAVQILVRREARDRRRVVRYAEWRLTLSRDHYDTLDVPDYLARLSPREYQAIHLRLWEGLDGTEMAERMGCAVTTARDLYRRGINRLRTLYDHS